MNNYIFLQEHYAPDDILQEASFNDITTNIQNMSLNKMKKEILSMKDEAFKKIKKLKNHDKVISKLHKKFDKSIKSISYKDINSDTVNKFVSKVKSSVETEMRDYGLMDYIEDMAGAFLITLFGNMVVGIIIKSNAGLALGIGSIILLISFIYSCVATVKITWGTKVPK